MAYVLTETSAGYALLKASDKKIYKSSSLIQDLDSSDKVLKEFKIAAFSKFNSAANALEEANSIIEGKVSSQLEKLLEEIKKDKKSTLIVSETKLANAINKLGLNFNVVSDAVTLDIYRAIKEYLPELLPGMSDNDLSKMSLGLAHSIGRHKLKFSADKVDVMIIQAIALLDDLDKELNTYAMRCKEWYGWHFPELAKIVTDSVAYARIILTMGIRSKASETDLSEILPEEIEERVKTAAEVSMGTEITQTDLDNINALAEQIVEFAAYREQLSNYLSARMKAIAPNLTQLVGELVGARLIAHSGSLISLAKSPASTIQILGAEKALFRALKTKHDTPKYGLLYHASLVGQATGKNKGKIARVLAAKAAVSLRYDALAEDRDDSGDIGLESRAKVENRLSQLEGRDLRTTPKVVREAKKVEMTEARAYNADADTAKAASDSESDSDDEEEEKKEKKEKKRKRDDDEDSKDSKKAKKEKKDKKEKKEKKEKKSKKEKKEKK
ncbi:Nucleolar protein 58 [Saccharomyces cerevisiae]|nr:Nucleolar protein 58 [Saccharomyces cerevisiae]CAI4992514.1 CFC_HP_G0095010.mRNA.1.CDS.1 [Saccharomyces cerevisiae]CAI6795713.1 ASN_HP1_G0050900.mRNA.1.CDS.1 [Saccharomyces cerevisiae]CAI6866651.1 CFC_HP_G0095010.mRNA.1.CDS.1 [Saccharomyces cerevisiae]CAI7469022.1 CFC_collapsed_G0052100.mRNA.1.CDS.1 [Saccharomyces cerevisiae]